MPERSLATSRRRRFAEIASWVWRSSLTILAVCSSGQSGGSPAPSTGAWTGTESCSGWTLSSVPGAPEEVAIPVEMMDASASVTQTTAGLVIAGLTLGPLAGWSCPNQVLVGSPSGPEDSNGVTYFSASTASCTTPSDDGGFAFAFTVSGDTYSSGGHDMVFLSLDLTPPAGAGAPSVTAIGTCTVYLAEP